MRRHEPVIAHCTDSEDFPSPMWSDAVISHTGENFVKICISTHSVGFDEQQHRMLVASTHTSKEHDPLMNQLYANLQAVRNLQHAFL